MSRYPDPDRARPAAPLKRVGGKQRTATSNGAAVRLLVIAVALVALAAPAAAGTTGKPACARELAMAEASLLKSLVRMQRVADVSQDEKCATFHTHADVVAKARDVFDRCSTGRAREQDVGQMDGALDQVKTAIASSCTAP